MLESIFEEFESLLAGLNYVVFFEVHRVPAAPHATSQQNINAAFGPSAIIRSTETIPAPRMIAEIERCLCYDGHPGCGPDPGVLQSPEFNRLRDLLLEELGHEITAATSIEKFWLSGGPSWYCIHWCFAFLLSGPGGATILIGDSSD